MKRIYLACQIILIVFLCIEVYTGEMMYLPFIPIFSILVGIIIYRDYFTNPASDDAKK